MRIGGIMASPFTNTSWASFAVAGSQGLQDAGAAQVGMSGVAMQPGGQVGGVGQTGTAGEAEAVGGVEDAQKSGKTKEVEKSECQTCKERKYQDGSDEMVSFKAAAHVSPEAAGARVRAHEQEHVTNAYKKAAKGDGKVLQASVRIHTAICPECGRSYVSGGTTSTKIAYKEENPYGKNAKSNQAEALSGNNINYAI